MSDNLDDNASWRECDRVYTNEKAGMSLVDKELVKKTIYDVSKDTEHFKNEQRKQKQVECRIERMKELAATVTAEREQALIKSEHGPIFQYLQRRCVREADRRLEELREMRDLSQIWLHVDMDAFFAAVEELHDPSLKGKPMAVGGTSMISTANYEARKYGVRSAMPGFIALKLCPDLVLVPNDFSKYRAASDQTRHVFRRYDPDFEAGSLDEAYLNVTDYLLVNGRAPSEVAAEMREAIMRETGLTCSVGIAPNCLLAKVASDINKPNGQHEISSDENEILAFLKTLPVRKVSGIGRVCEQMLRAFGMEYCSDLVEKRGLILALFSRSSAEFFMEIGIGIGRTSRHDPPAPGEIGRKGMSCERTFRPTHNKHDLLIKLEELSNELSRQLAAEGLKGKTLTLKLKSQTFEVHTRALTLRFYISSAKELYFHAVSLLESEMDKSPLRLMGIRLSQFETGGHVKQTMITDFMNKRSDATSDVAILLCCHRSPDRTEQQQQQSDWLVCEECDQLCCGEQCLQEHRDFHMAQTLQRRENTICPRRDPSSTKPKSRTRRRAAGRPRHKKEKFMTLDSLVGRNCRM